jgi:hypothetical protein
VVTDEVDDGDGRLALSGAEAASELLEEDDPDSVGRSITTRSTAGTSTPSLKMSTEQRASMAPRPRSWIAASRSSDPAPEYTALARTPRASSQLLTKSAWATLQQTTSVRMLLPRAPQRQHAGFRLRGGGDPHSCEYMPAEP